MPLYSFQSRFVAFVKDKSKQQTVRGIRKNPPKIGQPCTLVTGSRFKPVKIHEVKPLVESVDTLFIDANGRMFLLKKQALDIPSSQIALSLLSLNAVMPGFSIQTQFDFKELSLDEKDLFAWSDGFRSEVRSNDTAECFELMFRWWKATHQLPFIGHVTYWKF